MTLETNLLAAVKELDKEPRVPPAGYVAELHRSLRDTICVWAPCGCVVVINSATSVLTPCPDTDCRFSWIDANEALRLLQDSIHEGKSCEGNASIVPNPLALVATTATVSTSESPTVSPGPTTAETA